MTNTDPIADRVKAATAAHAALLRTGTEREITVAYLEVLRAGRALALDCGENPGTFDYEIEDTIKALEKLS